MDTSDSTGQVFQATYTLKDGQSIRLRWVPVGDYTPVEPTPDEMLHLVEHTSKEYIMVRLDTFVNTTAEIYGLSAAGTLLERFNRSVAAFEDDTPYFVMRLMHESTKGIIAPTDGNTSLITTLSVYTHHSTKQYKGNENV